ncbi:MAG: hypothetical protein ACOYJZ_12135 [Acutalibacter sp.]|jgi:acetyl esterase/lipase
MPDWKDLERQMERMEKVRMAFGPTKRKAIPVFEDCVNYPTDQVVAMANLARKIEGEEYGPGTEEEIRQFQEMPEKIRPVENPKPRIYLWEEGKVPTLTQYTDPADYHYNHGPEFQPYFFEMLLPQDVEPKGAVILCAGGDHGDAVVAEAYQTALDFNKMGYQCFVLLNRTNHSPWNAKEAGVDAARAVRMVRRDAAKYRISPGRIAFAGFSNGGLTGEGLLEYYSGCQKVEDVFPDYQPDALDEMDATPDAFLCVYGPRFEGGTFDYQNVEYPPTFFAVGREDTAMDNLNDTVPDLLKHGVEVEVHTFAGVPHGQAGARIFTGEPKYPSFELWLPLADAFLQDVYRRKEAAQ